MEKLALDKAAYGALSRSLEAVDFFGALTVAQLEKVLPHIMLFFCKDGETVFKQGAAGDAFYIVYEGAVDVRVKGAGSSADKTLQILGPGQFFGEMALIGNDARNATVVCKGPTKLFALMSFDFDFILKENPSFAEEMRKSAARRKFASSRGG